MAAIPLHIAYATKLPDGWPGITDVDANWQEFPSSRQIWLLQTFCILRTRHPGVTLGRYPRPECVNLIYRSSTGLERSMRDFYFVNVRGDKEATWWANYEVVQNRHQEGRRAIYITHWPQPGLVPRDPARSRIENVAFLGNPEQNALDDYPVEKDLRAMGLNYIGMDRRGWNDYSEIDLSLAVRGFAENEPYNDKPPSKLINAWWANVPMIGGKDSAYEQVGSPGRDYIQVGSYEELLEQVLLLKENPRYYRDLVEEGIRKREQYSRERIAEEWLRAFEEVIFPDFQRWNEAGSLTKLVRGASRWTARQAQRVARKVDSKTNRIRPEDRRNARPAPGHNRSGSDGPGAVEEPSVELNQT